MNKKIIVLIIAIVVIAAGVGIWLISSNNNSNEKENADTNSSNSNMNENENNDVENTEENTTTEDNKTSNNKIAIIYFSATGTTEKVAGYIKDITGGDLIEIEPKEKYTDNDLNYNNENSRATREQKDSSIRPEISNNIDTDSYDVIFLGYPIWWGDSPKIILTFLDEANLSGKTVIPFCTSGSSGINTSVDCFKKNYKDINWLDGKRLEPSQSEVTNWVNGLNY